MENKQIRLGTIRHAMTPNEKAAQLIVDNQLKVRSLDYDEAVQCAIVMVDEIIDAIDWHKYETPNDQLEYWFEVKRALERALNTMTLREALLTLEAHQKWRLGDEFAQKTEPSKLTEAINTILQYHIGNTEPLKDHIGEANKMINQALRQYGVMQRSEQLPCEHRSYRAGHSPFVPCICNDCGEEL